MGLGDLDGGAQVYTVVRLNAGQDQVVFIVRFGVNALDQLRGRIGRHIFIGELFRPLRIKAFKDGRLANRRPKLLPQFLVEPRHVRSDFRGQAHPEFARG